MVGLWRNNDYRKMVVNILFLFGAVLLLFGFMLSVFFNGVRQGILEQDASLAGILVEKHPELEDDLIEAIRSKSSAGELNAGYAVLKQYGIDNSLATERTPVLNKLYPGTAVTGIILLIMTLIGVCTVVTRRMKKLYSRIEEISDLAEQVVEGDFDKKLPSGGEGSFAILGHRFNQMTNRLKLTMESLKKEKTFLRDIIADISHQLKTPLSTLIINQDLLLANPDMDVRTRTGFLESGNHQLARLQWLIQSLLKMARLESGSISFKSERVVLPGVVSETLEALNSMAGDSKVELEFSSPPEDVYCIGDRDWLIEALVNIVKNSIEHTPPGGKVSISLFKSSLFSGVIIRDNGEGIDPKDLPHIFERFYRGSGISKPSSVGIGLSLSKAIIEGHGGSIRVQSRKGVGSEFTVTFLLNA